MTARQGFSVRRVARGTLAAIAVVAGLAVVGAQTPAPAQAPAGQTPARGAGRGIQAPAYPVLPLGSPFPDFALKGVDNKIHTLKEYAKPKVRGGRVREQSLSGLDQLRGPRPRALREVSRQEFRDRRDQPEQPRCRAAERARLHGHERFARRDEDPRGVSAAAVPLSLRRRDAGAVDEIRRGRDAAHFHLRPGPKAPLSGSHRRQRAD